MEEKKKTNIFLDDQEEDSRSATDKLNEYIRVGSTGGFILILALIMAVAALLIWGFSGKIPVTYTEVGIVTETNTASHSCICFVDVNADTGVIQEGRSANVRMPDGKTFPAILNYFSTSPYSAEELKEMFSESPGGDPEKPFFSDWMMDKILDGCNYAYLMKVETTEDISDYWHEVVQVTVVIDEVRPISFLLQ